MVALAALTDAQLAPRDQFVVDAPNVAALFDAIVGALTRAARH